MIKILIFLGWVKPKSKFCFLEYLILSFEVVVPIMPKIQRIFLELSSIFRLVNPHLVLVNPHS